MENRSDKWRDVARCNSTKRDSVVEAARRAAVGTNSPVHRQHIPMAPVVAANHLQTKRLVNNILLIYQIDYKITKLLETDFSKFLKEIRTLISLISL